jgi:hypothetical protein
MIQNSDANWTYHTTIPKQNHECNKNYKDEVIGTYVIHETQKYALGHAKHE